VPVSATGCQLASGWVSLAVAADRILASYHELAQQIQVQVPQAVRRMVEDSVGKNANPGEFGYDNLD
jgi:hypothetical protein